nr:mating type protein MAT1-2-1 [Diaporthe caulivora]WRY74194.1 mating type protein MAT1-2-1 [Diaporthe caulivora]WRY74195.1 mating type protein MAT1-2-1 [Diaporthe caulivora]
MATLQQNLIASITAMKRANLPVEFHVSPTLTYVLNYIGSHGTLPNGTSNPFEFLNIIDNMGIQLHIHNAAKVCAVDAIAWDGLGSSDQQLILTIINEITRLNCAAMRDTSCPSRLYVGPEKTLQLVNALAVNIKIPRPPNPFIIYRTERHQTVKDANPDAKNNDISKILGKQWQMEPDEVRDAYKKKSEAIKEEFMRVYPEYKYQPRKSSEVKRRSKKATQDSE